MPRVNNSVATRRRRKKILKRAKGFRGARGKTFKTARETVIRADAHAYSGRKQKKRDYRKLWIQRINAAARKNNMSYSKFIHGLKKAGVELNRKSLAEIAMSDEESFSELVKLANKV